MADNDRERGVPEDLARQVAIALHEHDPLEAHLREELGHSEATAARPLQASLASATSFLAGGLVPTPRSVSGLWTWPRGEAWCRRRSPSSCSPTRRRSGRRCGRPWKAVLRKAGLLTAVRRGRYVHYRLDLDATSTLGFDLLAAVLR